MYFPFEVKKAKLTISVLGFCELYFNGKKITDDLFITTWSQYDKFLPENAIITLETDKDSKENIDDFIPDSKFMRKLQNEF